MFQQRIFTDKDNNTIGQLCDGKGPMHNEENEQQCLLVDEYNNMLVFATVLCMGEWLVYASTKTVYLQILNLMSLWKMPE